MTICPTTHREVLFVRRLHLRSACWTFQPFLRAPSFAATATAIGRESRNPPFATATVNILNALPADLRRRSCQWGLTRAHSACHALFLQFGFAITVWEADKAKKCGVPPSGGPV